MPFVPGSGPLEHGPQERHEELRLRVLRLHRVAADLDARTPEVAAPSLDDVDRGSDLGGGLGADRIRGVISDTVRLSLTEELGGRPFAGGAGGVPTEPDPRLSAAVDELLAAADELLALEDRLPVLRDLPARTVSVQVVRAAALAAALGAVLLGLGIWRGLLSHWWSPLLVVQVIAAVRPATLTVAPAAGAHRRQRRACAVTGASALLLAPAASLFGWPAGLLCLVVLLGGLAVLFDVRWGRR